MNAHKVKSESVNVEFVNPVLHALDHKLAHQRTLRCRLVATTRTVRVTSVGCLAIVIVGISTLEVAAFDVERMIIHSVEDNTDACLVQCLHHGLELAYAHLWLVWICRVAAFGHIVVFRVVAPIELWAVQLCLVYRSIVKERLKVDGVDAETLQIGYGARFGESQILALMLHARSGTDGEVAHVKLVDNLVGRRRKSRTAVVSPSFRIGVSHIQYCATVAVDAYSLGKRARTLALADVEGVEHAGKIALDCGFPTVVAYSTHLNSLDGFASLSALVQAELGGRRRVEMEYGLCLAVFHLIELPLSIGADCHH